MSPQPNGNKAGDAFNSQNIQQSDSGKPDSSDSAEKREPGGFPAIGKAIEPLTQPINYAIKGTTRTINSTVGVTTSVANGLVSGTTSALGYAAEAALPNDSGKPIKNFTDGLGKTTTAATAGAHRITESATNGLTDTLTDTVTGVSNADILGVTTGATGGLGDTVSGTGSAIGDTLGGAIDGIGTTAGGPVGKGVSNLGIGADNLVTGVTTGVGDGVAKLGQGDALGSLDAIGGGLKQGVSGLATGVAGYGRNTDKESITSENTFFGIDFGEKAGKLKDWATGEEGKSAEERKKSRREVEE